VRSFANYVWNDEVKEVRSSGHIAHMGARVLVGARKKEKKKAWA
jgi:hypothetical protein